MKDAYTAVIKNTSTEIPHLSLAQVYAALAYYHANRDEIESDIAAEEAETERLERKHLSGQFV